MKKRFLIAAAFLAPVMLMQLAGCSGDAEEDQNTIKQEPDSSEDQMEDQVFYQIPTPNELFTVM
ncbi:MAG: hypothetical protein ACHQF2_06275, partial [Flavobacteriales bacterium]